MAERPYTLLSCCTSLDGYLDGASGERLVLSHSLDLDRVDAVRAGCDAILVGAATVRLDDPRLLVRSPARLEDRVTRGMPAQPMKVTLTRRAELAPGAAFFSTEGEKVVYCANGARADALSSLARVVRCCDGDVDVAWLSADLHSRGVRRLLVEGGGSTLTQFLAADLVDELHLAVAPFFVGDSHAPRWVGDGAFPWHPGRRATLLETGPLGDVVLLRYALSDRCPTTEEPG